MNYIKKTFLPFILLWAFIPYGVSQNSDKKKKPPIKPFYTVEANFGISTCKILEHKITHGVIIIFDAKLHYQTLAYGANFAAGIELTHYFKAGLGLGYFYYKQKDNRIPWSGNIIPNSISTTTHGIPLFLYLRSDFLESKISPYVDFKIGNNFLITKETIDYVLYGKLHWKDFGSFRLKNGLFLASNIGIALKTNGKTAINVSVGYRYISRDYDAPYEVYLVPTEIKYRNTGLIAADHQFLLSMGVSF